MTKKNKQRGFTIIEVALVLAVAALIFLVVFLAVPALQRNQRDDARKRDVSNVVQAVVNSVANRNAQLITGAAYDGSKLSGTADVSKLGEYLDTMSGNVDYINVVGPYTKKADIATALGTSASTTYDGAPFLTTQTQTAATTTEKANTKPYINKITVYTGVSCEGNVGIKVAAKRSAAIAIQVENGGDGKYYCQNAN
jgi:prepilin-type N-terminal cleavage/methylation domain-containing protein